MKKVLLNSALVIAFIGVFGSAIYYTNQDEKNKSSLYKIKIRGAISDTRYSENVDFLSDKTISFVDFQTKRLMRVSSEYVVMAPKNK